jgi:hypothetical protein
MTKYKEEIQLGELASASSWGKFTLPRFCVDFKRTTYTPLTVLITDPMWYDPHTEESEDFEKGEFVERISHRGTSDRSP